MRKRHRESLLRSVNRHCEPPIHEWQELLNQNKGAWQSAYYPLSMPINCRLPCFARKDSQGFCHPEEGSRRAGDLYPRSRVLSPAANYLFTPTGEILHFVQNDKLRADCFALFAKTVKGFVILSETKDLNLPKIRFFAKEAQNDNQKSTFLHKISSD